MKMVSLNGQSKFFHISVKVSHDDDVFDIIFKTNIVQFSLYLCKVIFMQCHRLLRVVMPNFMARVYVYQQKVIQTTNHEGSSWFKTTNLNTFHVQTLFVEDVHILIPSIFKLVRVKFEHLIIRKKVILII